MKHAIAGIGTAFAFLAVSLLAGCGTASAPAPQIQPRAQLPWQAAIGELETGTPDAHCSAVLVARDVIATASHCLFLASAKRPATPNEIVFRPNMGGLQALPPSRGVAFKAIGAVIRGGKIRNEDVSNDWALIQISPPVVAVQPLPVAGLPIAGMLEMIKSGDRLITAGYGNGPYEELKQHKACRLIPQSELGLFPDDSWLQLDCIFRVGDSGGGILLVDGAGQPALIGIITGFGHMPKSTEPLGLGVNASQFLRHLGPLISRSGAPESLVELAGKTPALPSPN